MTKQLTDSERDYLIEYWFTEPLNSRHVMPDDFKQGFVAGLSYNQVKLDSERQERIEFNKQTQAKLDKLIRFIKGKVTRSEIEDILDA